MPIGSIFLLNGIDLVFVLVLGVYLGLIVPINWRKAFLFFFILNSQPCNLERRRRKTEKLNYVSCSKGNWAQTTKVVNWWNDKFSDSWFRINFPIGNAMHYSITLYWMWDLSAWRHNGPTRLFCWRFRCHTSMCELLQVSRVDLFTMGFVPFCLIKIIIWVKTNIKIMCNRCHCRLLFQFSRALFIKMCWTHTTHTECAR